jgi:hypothetical protein
MMSINNTSSHSNNTYNNAFYTQNTYHTVNKDNYNKTDLVRSPENQNKINIKLNINSEVINNNIRISNDMKRNKTEKNSGIVKKIYL